VSAQNNTAVCCGIVGGGAVEFLNYYADTAIRMIQHPRNRAVWASIGSTVADNILVEQYLLSACVAFHGRRKDSKYAGTTMRYLFRSSEEAFDDSAAARAGYTHLIGGAKSEPNLAHRLEERVRREYPDYYRRCIAAGE